MFWNGIGIAICCPIALQTDLVNIANGDDPPWRRNLLGVARTPVDAIPRQPPDRFPAPVRTLPGYAKENFMDCRNVLSRRVL
jgi:hypothetical protein